MIYIRVNNKVVDEVFIPHSGFTIEECFHPDLVKQFIPSNDENIKSGWIQNDDGTFSEPPKIDTVTHTTNNTP